MSLLAVDGLTLDHAVGSTITGGVFTIVSSPSQKTFVDDNGIFTSPLVYTFSGGSAPGFVAGTVATTVPQQIIGSAQKTLDYDIIVMRESDSGTMQCSGTLTGGGTGTVSGDVEISDAGQDKVEGE